MTNPLFREFADVVIQNRDVVSDVARKWGSRKQQRPEDEAAAGFDPGAVEEDAAPKSPPPPRDESRERLTALEAALAEARVATEAVRADLDEARSHIEALRSEAHGAAAAAEALGRKLDALETRTASQETALQHGVTRVTALEADAVRRTRRFAIVIAILAAWSIAISLAVHYLVR